MVGLLAIDSGGTKCEALLTDSTGRSFGYGRVDGGRAPGEFFTGGLGRSEDAIDAAVAQALANGCPFDALHVAAQCQLPNRLFRNDACVVIPHPVREVDAPLAFVRASKGVVVLAGTGAFAYGKSPSGRELLLDGMGPMLGDYGSGYQIGLAGIRAAAQAEWSPRYETILKERVRDRCRELSGVPEDRFDLVRFSVEPRDRSEIASLSVVVDQAAEDGDPISKRILRRCAGDMVETVRCVVQRLGIQDDSLPLVGTGSVAVKSVIYWDAVCEGVREYAPHFIATKSSAPPVCGYVLHLADLLGLRTEGLEQNLSEAIPPVK